MAVLSLEDFKAYVEVNLPIFMESAFMGFKSSNFLTHYGGNKGKMTIQDITYNQNPIGTWKVLEPADFTQKGDAATLEMDSYLLQLRDGYVPTELEKTYAGVWRQRGQDPMDFPLAMYMLEQAGRAVNWQIARLIWQAKTGHASGGVWDDFNGILAQVAAGVGATHLTEQVIGDVIVRPNSSATAGVGETAAVDAFEEVWDALPEAVKQEGVNIYCSPAMARKYNKDYRNVYRQGATVDPVLNRVILDVAGEDDARAVIIPTPEMGTSTRIIATAQRNMYYTYDMDGDQTKFNIVEYYNSWHFWSDFRIGGGVHHANDEWMAVSDGE